ncbi:MAG: LysM peptidoglycan-binding domain-containing protein [Clostridia bacterium]|nr:LysM peptidoglycan-binding domain-containing protein [Clostridia bacterium]
MLEGFTQATEEELKNTVGGVGNKYYLYTVKKGDNLSKIAVRFRTTADEIYALNQDRIEDKDLIQPGWKLLIPAAY